MKLFSKFTHKEVAPDTVVYTVEGMHCSHCEAAVCRALEDVEGIESAKASATRNTLTIKGPAPEAAVRAAATNHPKTPRITIKHEICLLICFPSTKKANNVDGYPN